MLSPLTSAEVKNNGAIVPLPHTSSWHNAYWIKHRTTLPFTFNQKDQPLIGYFKTNCINGKQTEHKKNMSWPFVQTTLEQFSSIHQQTKNIPHDNRKPTNVKKKKVPTHQRSEEQRKVIRTFASLRSVWTNLTMVAWQPKHIVPA
jgi:2-oxoglutarate dehydrogenase complex dehydrogenase (E1) component-like enzyme